MPKEPRDRELRAHMIDRLDEVAKLAALAQVIDIDVLRDECMLVPQGYDGTFDIFTLDEWEELQSRIRGDTLMLVGSLRQHRKDRLIRDPEETLLHS